jgi:pimeloyl-ACP methyl ester carboxylesterase
VSAPAERSITVNGKPCRVWEKGTGAPVGYLAGLLGLPKWTPFLDKLAARRRVIVPSIPGFSGALGHDQLDTHLDWIATALDLVEGAGLVRADLIGASVGGTLAAEVAAIAPTYVKKLVLLAPFGIYDEREPVLDVFAQAPGVMPGIACAQAGRVAELLEQPKDLDPIEWQVAQVRAQEAAARLLWPTSDTGIAKRLHRIQAPTLLIWGSRDAVIPASYAKRFADGIRAGTQVRSIDGAGHLVDLDAPDAVAEAVLGFLG